MLAALMVKEVAVTLPLALLLWDRACAPAPRPWRDDLRRHLVHWALLIGVLGLWFWGAGYGRLAQSAFEHRGVADNLRSQVNAIVYLLSRLVMLNGLDADPELPVFERWSAALLAQAALLAAALAAGVLALTRRPWIGFGVLWAALHLLPGNSIIPRYDLANERQLYLANVGIFMGFAALLAQAAQRLSPHTATLAATVLATALAIATADRNRVYRDEISFWQDAATKSPTNARAHNNLGYAYAKSGRFDDARRAYGRALELRPGYQRARNNLRALPAPDVPLPLPLLLPAPPQPPAFAAPPPPAFAVPPSR